MSAEMNIDHQAYQPVVMYLNGEYWGIINMREKVNEHFIASNHDVYADDVNLLEGNGWLIDGDASSYQQLYNYVTSTDLSDPDAYNSVKTMMDVPNFIRYWTLNVYIDNKDWPGNNNKFWSTSAPGSLYRWISYDTDFGYSIWDNYAYQVNTLAFSLSQGEITWANQEWATAMMRSLLKNKDFRNAYINEYADRMNTTFSAEHMVPVIDSFEARLLTEAPAHYARWTNEADWLSYKNWPGFVERMRTYLTQRPNYMRRHLIEQFTLAGTKEVTIDVWEENGGTVKINATKIKEFPFKGTYFQGVPIRLEAIPAPGYTFSEWVGRINSDSTVIEYNMGNYGNFTAFFDKVDTVVNIVINEINYASNDSAEMGDWLELYNNSGVAVDLSGWSIVEGYSQDAFIIPEGTVLQKDAYIVFDSDLPDFKRYEPELQPVKGNLPFRFNAEKFGIALNDANGELHDYVDVENELEWPQGARGTGMTLELIHPALDNTISTNWKVSIVKQGTPCALNSQYDNEFIDSQVNLIDNFHPAVYPSPFREETYIHFSLEKAENVFVSVYSVNGTLVDRILDEPLQAGIHTITWKPDVSLPGGLYFIQIRTDSHSRSMKVIRN